MSHTFNVNDVQRGALRVPLHSAFEALSHTLGETDSPQGPVPPRRSPQSYECIDVREPLHGSLVHPFVWAAATAFNHHLPLRFGPDHVWALVLQGVSLHILQEPEAHRHLFVEHEGRERISIEFRDDRFGVPTLHGWRELLDDFTLELELRLKDDFASFVCAEFSTTGAIERAVYRASLMHTLKEYFEYEFYSVCGIPSITLDGSEEDWCDLRDRVRQLDRFGLKKWRQVLGPICDQFVSASRGFVDGDFWRSWVQYQSMSGGDRISGWVTRLFPYLEWDGHVGPNALVWNKPTRADAHALGVEVGRFPGAVNVTPMEWRRGRELFDMQMLSGFFGMTQCEASGEVCPQLGWAMRYAQDPARSERDAAP